MGFFRKDKQEKDTQKNTGTMDNKQNIIVDSDINGSIKVLGSCCDRCDELTSNIITALNECGINQNVSHITDFLEIAKHGVMSTPGLVINNRVISVGKVLNVRELKEILEKEEFK